MDHLGVFLHHLCVPLKAQKVWEKISRDIIVLIHNVGKTLGWSLGRGFCSSGVDSGV